MKLLAKTKQRTTFEEVLTEAVRVKLELQRSENPNAQKASLEGMRREALAAAKTTPERVAVLQEALEADPTRFQKTWRSIRKSAVELGGPNIRTLHRLTADNAWLRVNGWDEAASELALVTSHPLEALCIAVEEAGKRHPETFGEIDDYPAWEQRMADLRQRLQQLFERIEREAQIGTDLQILDGDNTPASLRAQGYVRLGFVLSGGAVTMGPQAGERLVNYLVGQPEVLRQLGVKV